MLDGEVIDGAEGVGEGGEEAEEHGEVEAGVEGEECDQRLRGEHMQRTDQGDGDHGFPFGGCIGEG